MKSKVTLTAGGDELELLRRYSSELEFIFIVSHVDVVAAENAKELQVSAAAAEGQKCERCWHITTDVGSNERFPTACERCATNMSAGW